VRVRVRRRRIARSVCGRACLGVHDRQLRRSRHLDLAGHRCFIGCELRRLDYRDCGVRVEAVPWARRGARHTREFEDLVCFCAQRMAKSQLQRCSGSPGTRPGGSSPGSSPISWTTVVWTASRLGLEWSQRRTVLRLLLRSRRDPTPQTRVE
jgi:hypothetical protein